MLKSVNTLAFLCSLLPSVVFGQEMVPCTEHADCAPNAICYCDSQGNRIRAEIDEQGDGTLDQIVTYVYDEHGNMLAEELDDDTDGVANRRYVYTYDERGNTLSAEADFNADGIPERSRTYTYDERGNRLSDAADSNADGEIDHLSIYSYHYDDFGNLLSRDVDEQGDGEIEERCSFDPPCPPPFNSCERTCVFF